MKSPSKETIMVFAIFVGLGGLFYFFGIPSFSQYYNFIHQGQPSLFASELSAPPIPPMSAFDLLKGLIPATAGLIASALYVIIAFLYFITKKSITKVIAYTAMMDIVARIGLALTTPIFHPLPTASQNILAGIFFTGPFVLCGIFSALLLFFLRNVTDEAGKVSPSVK